MMLAGRPAMAQVVIGSLCAICLGNVRDAVALGVIGVSPHRRRQTALGRGRAFGHLHQPVQIIVGDELGLCRINLIQDRGQFGKQKGSE